MLTRVMSGRRKVATRGARARMDKDIGFQRRMRTDRVIGQRWDGEDGDAAKEGYGKEDQAHEGGEKDDWRDDQTTRHGR